MSSKWPSSVEFKTQVLQVEERICRICGNPLHQYKDRIHCIYSFEGPLQLVCKLSRCSNKECSESRTLINPKSEISLTMPRWRIGWDLFLWMGFRRFKRHWSVPQIHRELSDSYGILLSKDIVVEYLKKYQVMVAARHQDLSLWKEIYSDCSDLILSIDGLQPEKGHETIYVVRELRKRRVWFAEPLISSSAAEIRKLLSHAKELAEELGKPVKAWVSDKQDAFVTSIAAEFPGVPHRYCMNHFMRDLAKPMLEEDSHVKVQMRHKVRGLRKIEKEILSELDKEGASTHPLTQEQTHYAANIVLDYCSAVRGILNDNHGGPLQPPGLRMAEALEEVFQSIERNLKLGETPISSKLKTLNRCIKRGLSLYDKERKKIVRVVKIIQRVMETLNPETGTSQERLAQFRKIQYQLEILGKKEPSKTHMFLVMQSFQPGLFVESEVLEIPEDNLDLEGWFKTPKGHERNIHGRQHAGIRIVNEGPTLLLALDAHLSQENPFSSSDLLPYIDAEIPKSQRESIVRNRVMKNASSKKKDLVSWER